MYAACKRTSAAIALVALCLALGGCASADPATERSAGESETTEPETETDVETPDSDEAVAR